MFTTILLGGITHHYLGSNRPYCNTINNVGTIVNPYIVAMSGTNKAKAGFIVGTDSACGRIAGPVASFNLASNLDFIVGGYNTNFKEFKNSGIEPVSIRGITPILGLNYKIPLTSNISLDNIISVGIVSHAISFNF